MTVVEFPRKPPDPTKEYGASCYIKAKDWNGPAHAKAYFELRIRLAKIVGQPRAATSRMVLVRPSRDSDGLIAIVSDRVK